VARLTDMLLRSVMTQEAPTPSGASLIVAAASLPPAIRDRLTRDDLRGLAWRAWSADGQVVFMAGERLTANASAGTPEILRVTSIRGARETRLLWVHMGGGRWECVDDPPAARLVR
jgi:hypothetical protein